MGKIVEEGRLVLYQSGLCKNGIYWKRRESSGAAGTAWLTLIMYTSLHLYTEQNFDPNTYGKRHFTTISPLQVNSNTGDFLVFVES